MTGEENLGIRYLFIHMLFILLQSTATAVRHEDHFQVSTELSSQQRINRGTNPRYSNSSPVPSTSRDEHHLQILPELSALQRVNRGNSLHYRNPSPIPSTSSNENDLQISVENSGQQHVNKATNSGPSTSK